MAKTTTFLRLLAGLLLLLLLVSGLAGSFYAPPSTQPRRVSTKVAPTQPASPADTLEIPASPPDNFELAPVQAALSAPPSGIGDEYLALGDSVAYGVGAPSPNEQGYSGQFFNNYLKRVQPRLSIYKDFGVPGETSSTFIQNGRGQSQLQRALNELDMAKKANRIISPITLTIGGNDMLDVRNASEAAKDAALAKYEANLQQILDALKSHAASQSLIIVTTYFNPFGNVTGQDEDVAWIQRFNASIQQHAQERGLPVADFYTPILNEERNLTWINYGDVHPNSGGYARLARAVWQASGYDTVPPTLSLVYSNLPKDGRVIAGQRFAFKLNVQDNWAIPGSADAGARGAGTIWSAMLSTDDNPGQDLPTVPGRFISTPGAQQYTYLLDTIGLNLGSHLLRFSATDAAGNQQNLDLNFEIVG